VLSKAVCQKCIKKWDYYTELEWEKYGLIHCPVRHPVLSRTYFGTKNLEKPPWWCPFALEHLVATQNVEKVLEKEN